MTEWTCRNEHERMNTTEWTWQNEQDRMSMMEWVWQNEHETMNTTEWARQNEHDGMSMTEWTWDNEHDRMNMTGWVWQDEHKRMNMTEWTRQNEHDRMSMTEWAWQNEHDRMSKIEWVCQNEHSRSSLKVTGIAEFVFRIVDRFDLYLQQQRPIHVILQLSWLACLHDHLKALRGQHIVLALSDFLLSCYRPGNQVFLFIFAFVILYALLVSKSPIYSLSPSSK